MYDKKQSFAVNFFPLGQSILFFLSLFTLMSQPNNVCCSCSGRELLKQAITLLTTFLTDRHWYTQKMGHSEIFTKKLNCEIFGNVVGYDWVIFQKNRKKFVKK